MCHSDFFWEVAAQQPLRSPSRGVEMENQYTVKNDVSSLRLHTQSQYSFLNTVHTSKGKRRHSEKEVKLLLRLSFQLRSCWAPFSANFWFRSAYCRPLLFSFSFFFFNFQHACTRREKMMSLTLAFLCKLRILTHFDKANKRNQNAIKFLCQAPPLIKSLIQTDETSDWLFYLMCKRIVWYLFPSFQDLDEEIKSTGTSWRSANVLPLAAG